MAKILIDTDNKSEVIPTIRRLQPTQKQVTNVFLGCYLATAGLTLSAEYLCITGCFSQPKEAEFLEFEFRVIFKVEKNTGISEQGKISLAGEFHPEYISNIIYCSCADAIISYGVFSRRKDLLDEVWQAEPGGNRG